MDDFFKNLTVNLKATGLAAVLITWLICFTIIALFVTSDIRGAVIGIMGSLGILLVLSIGKTPPLQ